MCLVFYPLLNSDSILISMVKKRANWMQQWWFIDKFELARHVSGNSFAHHQEH